MRLILMTLLFIPTSVQAIEVILKRENHLGVRRWDVIHIEKNHFYLNGKDLGSSLPPPLLQAWKEIEKGPDETMRPHHSCSAGRFQFIKKSNSKEEHRQGCSQGKSYARVIQSIESLRKYARGL